MRILQIVPDVSNADGITNVLIKYLRELSKKNVVYDFLCFNANKNDENLNYFRNEIEDLKGEVYYISSPFNPISFFKEWKLFCKKYYGRYDYLENNLTFLGFFFKNAKKELGVKKIITHSHVTKFGDNFLSNIRNKFFFYLTGMPLGDVLFSCSSIAGKEMFGKRIYKKPWYIINNAFNIEVYKYNTDIRKKIRKEMNWNGKFVIGHVGRFTAQKNHEFIIKLFKRYTVIDKNAILVLVGEGKLKEKILGMVSRAGIQDKVFFLGIRDDVPYLLQGFDMFLFPSRFEGLGLSVVEAQIAGLHCVVSDNVPKEANITNYIPISLKTNINTWVNMMKQNSDKKRILSGYKAASSHGFNISTAAKQLYEIYNKIGEDNG